MPASLWVAVLAVSERTAAKINGLHWLTVGDVEDAVVCRAGLTCSWDHDPERGLRALVNVTVRGLDVLVVLYPAPEDPWGETFRLGSAYRR